MKDKFNLFILLLTVCILTILIFLKWFKVIEISWWLVLSPVYVPLALGIFLYLVFSTAIGFNFKTKNKEK